MKFFAVVVAFAASAIAQRVSIGAPSAGTSVAPGEYINVEVDKPNSLSGSTDVGLAIGILSCASLPNGCDSFDFSQDIGTVVYTGPYNPQLTDPSKPPNQNFSVQIPASLAQGPASLNVAHFALIGAGPAPFLEVQNVTLNVVTSVSGRRSVLFRRD